jgi:glycosyltransferase involved in cell wall biosynthesis
MRDLGVRVSYIGELLPIHSLNMLLLPAELAIRRLCGGRIIHLHWVWGFQLFRARRLSQVWFGICLLTIRLLGLRLAWTAHNVLPHSPVFADDVAARRTLVGKCDVVFGHSTWTFTRLAELGAVPRRAVLVRHAPFSPQSPVIAANALKDAAERRELLFFGKIMEYKGVEELLRAFAALAVDGRVHLTVAGQCPDPDLRARVDRLARQAGDRVSLRLEYVADDEIAALMAAADAVVLPFRRVTTSGSAILALAHGKPIVIPELAALAELPDHAVFRYDGSPESLTATLREVAATDSETLARMSAAALAYSAETSWQQAAVTTTAEFRSLLRAAPRRAAELAPSSGR